MKDNVLMILYLLGFFGIIYGIFAHSLLIIALSIVSIVFSCDDAD